MTKKILSTVAAAAVLATGAMAYEVDDLGRFGTSVQNIEVNGSQLIGSNHRDADVMIFPAFFAGNGYETQIRVVNTSDSNAIVAKVVFFEKDTSREIKDFNIYLSANDVWTGKVVEEGGKYYIVSSDDSAPLADINDAMATEDRPLKEEISANAGYFEVLKEVVVDEEYHKSHQSLRTAFKSWASNIRSTGGTPALVSEGIFNNVTLPHIEIDSNNSVFDSSFGANVSLTANTTLYGEVKLVNTTLKTAMAIQPSYYSDLNNSFGLVYLEGEKANAADIFLDRDSSGSARYLDDGNMARVGLDDIDNVIITYDDEAAMTNGNFVLMTAPFKRVLVQRNNGNVGVDNADVIGGTDRNLYTNVDLTNDNYGEYRAFASIYNNNEDRYNTVAFSPALPSYLVFTKEVQSTESIETPLSSYVAQAIGADSSFAKGGYIVIDFDAAGYDVFAIPTWMQGTYVNGQAVTNWSYPATNIQ